WLENERGHPEGAVKIYRDVLGRISSDKTLTADEKTEEQSGVCGRVLAIIEQFYVDKNYEKSQKLSQECLQALENKGVTSQLKDMVTRQIIQSMVRRGQTEKAKPLVEGLLKHGGSDWRNLKLKAWMANESGQFEEAAKIYEDIFQRVGQDAALDPDDRIEEQK